MRPLVGIAAALLASGGAAAQDVGQFPQRQELASQASISAAMGRCVLKRDRRDAAALVMADEGAARAKLNARLRPDMIACLHQAHSATLDGLHVVGAIAEALLADGDGALLARAATLPPASPQRIATEEGAAFAVLACAASAAPAESVALLRAPAETPAEAAAFRALAPSLQACAPATGAVSIRPGTVRATVAITIYRRVAGTPS